MKIKFNRREKTILRLMILVVIIAIFSRVWAVYQEERIEIESRIESLQGQIATMDQKLSGESPREYLEEAAEIEEDLGDVRDSVLVLPTESDASLLVRQTISDRAEQAGIKINSISSRKSKKIDGADDLLELRVYFGYDAELGPLLTFFGSLEDEDYFMVLDTLNISLRRQIRNVRNNRRNKNRNLKQRSSLNGNAVIAVIFRADPEASLDRYSKPATVRVDKEPDVGPEIESTVEQGLGEGASSTLATQTIEAPEDDGNDNPPVAGEDARPRALPPPPLQPEPKPLTATGQPLQKVDGKPIKDRF